MIGRSLASNYVLLETVGRVGLADIYVGRDLRTNTTVRVKVLQPHFAADIVLLLRFLREAYTTHVLAQPHILRALEAGKDEGIYYIVMEHLQGETLAQLLQARGPLPIEEAMDYGRQLLEALVAAHRAGIVHGDIKPGYALVSADRFVKLTDFGVPNPRAAGTRRPVMHLGAPLYMAPELIYGEPPDVRSDLYAVAVIEFELIAGRPPFVAKDPLEMLRLQRYATPPPVSRFRPEAPPRLERWIACGLEKAPAQRFQSAEEMLAALERVLTPSSGEAVSAAQAPEALVARQAGFWAHRVSAAALWLALALLLLAAVLGVFGAALWASGGSAAPR